MVSAATMPDVLWPRSAGLTAVEKARKEFMDMRILVSIMGEGTDVDSWQQLAREAEQTGAEAIELNLGSVMMMESAGDALKSIMARRRIPSGAIIGLVAEVVAEIVKGIKRVISVPLIVKVTPELGFYGLLGAIPLYREAGVDGLTCDHSVMTMAAPDIYRRGKPTQPFFGRTTWWSSAGLWNRMVSYRDISLVGKYAPDIDTAACGGIVLPPHAVEVLMLGAKLVQLSSGILHNGPSFPGKVVGYLEKYMTQQGYRKTGDFIGLGLNYIGEMGEVQREFKEQIGRVVAHIDEGKCVGPNVCSNCADMFCLATNERDGSVYVDTEWCCGCNLCVIKCPHGARSLIEI
jgi:dihydroorotate dehydrogenase/Pyruvate/2-oxoacid:ferredoxin oxidoreductase delta subunit